MRIQQITVGCLIVLGAAVAIKSALAPRPASVQFMPRGDSAVVVGGTDSYSRAVVSNFVRDNPNVKRLILQAMPGTKDVVTNTRIARDIRRAGLATHVPADGRIASGAVDWFIAGATRTIECGAMIGVHSWGSPTGGRGDKTFFDPQYAYQRDFHRDMGISADFYEFTREAAGPDDIHWLSVAEMLRYGLLSQDPKCDG